MTHLALDTTGCSSAREIANRYHMPLPLLMNVLKQLAQQGLARSARGPSGGYTLALPASEITLRDIIEAVEGPVHLVRCLEQAGANGSKNGPRSGCELTSVCPVRRSIHRVHRRLVDFLGEVTLADIVENAPSPEAAPLSATAGD
jgi:Rrf2 family protein